MVKWFFSELYWWWKYCEQLLLTLSIIFTFDYILRRHWLLVSVYGYRKYQSSLSLHNLKALISTYFHVSCHAPCITNIFLPLKRFFPIVWFVCFGGCMCQCLRQLYLFSFSVKLKISGLKKVFVENCLQKWFAENKLE